MIKTVISTPEAPAAIGPYSQAIRVGNLLFTSGQIPLTKDGKLVPGGIKEQTRQVLTNISAIISAAGSNLDRIVKTTAFLKNMEDFAAFNEIYSEYFKGEAPARSAVEVARLPKDVLVEIEAIACLD